MPRPTIVFLILVPLLTAMTPPSRAQVQPAWLRAWNEAVAQRPAKLTAETQVTADDEPGEPFVISGRVDTPTGQPAADVIMLLYHRDAAGFELGPRDRALSTWRIKGWVKTDEAGQFLFRTVRPAADHLGHEAAHFHITTESARWGRQWAPAFHLADDPQVTAEERRQSRAAHPYGTVPVVTRQDGVEGVEIAIRLKPEADF